MGASVVTFTTLMGSGGTSISRAVAEKLRFRYYDWEIIARAAQEAGVSPEVLAVATSERPPGMFERVISRLASLVAGEEPPPGTPPPASLLNSDDYRQFLENVVRELARQGESVIVNRAGHLILKDVPGVLKVLVQGSLEARAARFAAAQGRDLATVRKTIEESDRQRVEYFKRVYHTDSLSSRHFDLVINTDHISTELAVDMIVASAREMP
jgi:cytidylate kinase